MRKKRTFKTSRKQRVLRFVLWFCVLVLLIFLIPELLVETHAKNRVFNRIDEVPKNKVGLLLGTSKRSSLGPNPYFLNRMDAAAELFMAGKIEYVLVSGDNGTRSYNEPADMRRALVKRGIPDGRIVLDYAGFRTLDSVVRAKKVFGQDKITVISQQFHNERALYIADKHEVDAVGFNAKDVGSERGLKVKIRERFARVKMMFDLLGGKEPKFLGEEIRIGE